MARRIQERVGDIGEGSPSLRDERRAKERIGHGVADSEGRFGTELLEDKLLDGVVEESPPCANRGLVWTPDDRSQQTIVPGRTPVDAQSWCEGLVIRCNQTTGNPFISR